MDGAAEEFTTAFDKGLSPREFVDTMRKENKLSKSLKEKVKAPTDYTLVPGIGHKVKSRNNPDFRVELVKEFVKKRFPSCKMLGKNESSTRTWIELMISKDYAIAVETVTTSKKDNLILNVDGCIAV